MMTGDTAGCTERTFNPDALNTSQRVQSAGNECVGALRPRVGCTRADGPAAGQLPDLCP